MSTTAPRLSEQDRIRSLIPYIEDPAERMRVAQVLNAHVAPAEGRARVGLYPVPTDWQARLRATFPKHVGHPFADRHVEFWSHVDAIELTSSPVPFCGFWPRGGGKSTGAELAAADMGCRDRRRYCLYVRETQQMADLSVANIAALLESKAVEDYYPHHADRMVGKYGNSKGWKRERLTTAGGYVVDAVGLDTASRGLKHEEQRPDLIIFDDIDGKHDSPATTAKKEAIITHSILPAGSVNCAVIFIQNLIIRDGIASKLADGRADYLTRRVVSGPFPALTGFTWEWKLDSASGIRRATIKTGTATWPGQPLEACQRFIDTWGLSAFLKEAQHRVKDRAEGLALRFDAGRHYIDLDDHQVRELVAQALRSRKISLFGGIDFGAWRFGFVLFLVTEEGICIRLDEYFAQRLPGEQGLGERAREIHETLEYYGIPVEADPSPAAASAPKLRSVPIWGDAANPTDIHEINLAWRNGWPLEYEDRGQRKTRHVTSRLRVVAVASENKLRKTSVERMNDMLDKSTLRYRRGISYEWRLGMNAGSEGTPQLGSRLVWEIENWSFALPKPGEEQDQDADDSTADGADLIAAQRYGLMSVYGSTRVPVPLPDFPDDRKAPFDMQKRKFVPPPHLGDLLTKGGRKIVPPRLPNPRGRS